MVHILGIAKGPHAALEEYKSKIYLQSYQGQLPNNIFASSFPNLRIFEFWEIEVDSKNLGQFYKELAPFGLIGTDAKFGTGKWWLTLWTKPFRFLQGIKNPPISLNKRKTVAPQWRDYIQVYSLGHTETGDKTKVWIMSLAQRKYLDEFKSHLERLEFKATNEHIQIEEIQFWDISLFLSQKGALYRDLRPYKAIDEPAAKWFSRQWLANKVIRLGRFISGLKDPVMYSDRDKPSKMSRDSKVELTIIGEKEDRWQYGNEMV
jgi:hypothetical protein